MSLALAETPITTPDFDAIKSKQKLMWASGNYAKVGSTLQLSGEFRQAVVARTGRMILNSHDRYELAAQEDRCSPRTRLTIPAQLRDRVVSGETLSVDAG